MPSYDCVFGEIVVGSAPASVVYHDDFVIASMDIRPRKSGANLRVARRFKRSWVEDTTSIIFVAMLFTALIAVGLTTVKSIQYATRLTLNY
ncbi:MAG TPA: hypothetical protein DC056_08865 [Dehalococcoidia bacterium]|nr:hypothetical protein [Dehalococcoidia bacterium]